LPHRAVVVSALPGISSAGRYLFLSARKTFVDADFSSSCQKKTNKRRNIPGRNYCEFVKNLLFDGKFRRITRKFGSGRVFF
jgi:hypothetical protein